MADAENSAPPSEKEPHVKRPVVIGLLVLILIAAAGIIAAQNLQEALPPQARAGLGGYLASENSVASQPAIVREVAHAARPGRFDAAFSAASIGASFYFRTTRGYRSAVTPNPLILTTSPLPAVPSESAAGGRALPFPPKDLWCVLLNEEGGNGRVVYLALHEDMYNADWIVHESAGTPLDVVLTARLAAVGCDLGH
jgi:hypothetical protein